MISRQRDPNNESEEQQHTPEIDVDEERSRLSSLSPLVIIDYVKSSVDILVSVSVEDAMIE
jgi:hypothetical protein